MKFQKAWLLGMVFVLLGGFTRIAWADEDFDSPIPGAQTTDFIKERSYIGGFGTTADIDQFGDFNGINSFIFPSSTTVTSGGTSITTNPEIDLVPSITRQFGWGVLIGHREGPWAAEVSFWRSDHTGTFYSASAGGPVTTTTPASLQAINIDFKRYFFTHLPTQPFVDLGISFPWLWVSNFSYITDNANPPNILSIDNETISGIGLNLGVGAEIYLDNNFSIVGGVYERWAEFDQINGASKVPLDQLMFNGDPNSHGALAGDGLNAYVGTTFGFK